MTLKDGRRGECGCGVPRRERAAFAGRPIAPDRVLHPLDNGLRDDLRPHQVEADYRESVCLRFISAGGNDVAANGPEADRSSDLYIGAADNLPNTEDLLRGAVADDVCFDVVVGGMCGEG